jgi:hypothetical protein
LVEKKPVYKYEWEKPLYVLPGGNEGFSDELFDDGDGTEVPDGLADVAEWEEIGSCCGYYGDAKNSGIVAEIAGVIDGDPRGLQTVVEQAEDAAGEWQLFMQQVGTGVLT